MSRVPSDCLGERGAGSPRVCVWLVGERKSAPTPTPRLPLPTYPACVAQYNARMVAASSAQDFLSPTNHTQTQGLPAPRSPKQSDGTRDITPLPPIPPQSPPSATFLDW